MAEPMTVIDRAQQLFLRNGRSMPRRSVVADARSDSTELVVSVSSTELSDAVHDALESLQVDADAGDCALELSVHPIRVEADPRRLRQIVGNLVSNAFRHGGDFVRVRAYTSSGFARVEVSDNGPGLDDEEAEAIFAPYDQAHPNELPSESVGLGLAVSRQLARLMGGDLVAFRDQDSTTFRLCVPVSEVPAAQPVAGD